MFSYTNTLNLIHLGIKHKSKTIKIPKNKRSEQILIVLLRYNVIKGWSLYKTKSNIYYIVYFSNYLKNIYILIKPSKKTPLKYKYIKIINTKYSANTIFILTSKGILSLKDAYFKKIGGFLFFRII